MTDLDEKEQKLVRLAIRLLWRKIGTWRILARTLGVQGDSLEKITNGRRVVSISMAYRVSKLMHLPLEDLLAGNFTWTGVCPHCGRKLNDFSDEDTIVTAVDSADHSNTGG